MLYCPKCGTKVKDDESYCIKCGNELPKDMMHRIDNKKTISKWWILPVVSIALIAITVGIYTYILQHKDNQALDLYTQAEQLVINEKYSEANELLQEALNQRRDFSHAETLLNYTNAANEIEKELEIVNELLNENNYQDSLEYIAKTEEKLTGFSGLAASNLVDKINQLHATTKLERLKEQLEESPSFQDLRILIWEAEGINLPEAVEIADAIRKRIVDYTFSRASEELHNHQFNDALLITEDGLKYAPDSERLQTLLSNILKEKLAFEADAEERMEQAMDIAYNDYQMNENDAIELLAINLENNEDEQIVIKGEVKSNATIPIHSVVIEYALLIEETEIITNETFVVPDTLYPSETGEFEFTHFDLEQESSELDIEVKKITWYTNEVSNS